MPNVVATKTKVGTKTKVAIAVAIGAGILALANAVAPLVFFSVTMKAPVSKAVLSGVTTLAASTSESAAAVSFVVSGLSVPVAGVNKDGTGRTWVASWDTSAVADGSYSVYATAKNAKGAVVTSAKVLFTVSNKKAAAPKTKPAMAAGLLPTTVLTNGAGTVLYRFTVTAGSTGDVSLKKLSFKASLTNAAGSVTSAAIREVGTGADIATTSDASSGGSNCGFAAGAAARCIRVVFAKEQIIAAGVSKKYDLRVTTAGFGGTDGITTNLLGDASAASGLLSGSAPATGIGGVEYNVLWSDNSAVPHSESTSDWFNGAYASGLPGAAQTLGSAGAAAAVPKTTATISILPPPSSVLTAGTMAYYRFTVTAGTGSDVALKKLSFQVAMTSASSTLALPGVRELGTASNVPASAAIATSGSDCGFPAGSLMRCVRVVFDAEHVIAAGASRTYDLRMDGSGFMTGDSVSTKLLGDGTAGNGLLSGTAPATGIAGTQHNFLWSDNSAVPHSETTSDWFNGAHASGLPGGAQTLTYS